MAKCPQCKKPIGQPTLTEMKAGSMSRAVRCVAYSCPLCQSILSVEIDPASLAADIAKSVAAEMKKIR